MIITFIRIITTGIRNFFRNSWLTIAATAVMTVALTMLLLAVFLNVTAKNAIDVLSQDLQEVTVFLNDDATESDIEEFRQTILENDLVTDVEFVDRQEAQQIFSDTFGDDQGIIEGLSIVGGDVLPNSLKIGVDSLDNVESVGEFVQLAQFSEIVDTVSLDRDAAQETIDRASSARGFILQASIIGAAVFGAVSILIIFNTIRMTTFTRSDEIRIMKLVGATPRFIRGPFIVEASLYGLIAGLISVGIIYLLIVVLFQQISAQAEFSATYNFFVEERTIALMLGGAVLSGMVVGVVSSALAMKRYLRLRNW